MLQIDTLPAFALTEDTAADQASSTCVYDSIFPIAEQAEPVLHKSLFTHHLLPVKSTHEITIQHTAASGWFFGFIVLSIFLICMYLRHKQIKMLDLLQSAIDHRAMDRMLRDTNLTHSPDLMPIALIVLIPIALIGYYAFLPHSSNIFIDILHYLLVLLGCYAVYFVRNGFIRLLGNAFNNNESVHVYISSNYIYHILYGIATSAMAFFICFTGNVGQTFLYILLGILGVLLVFRIIRGMLIILTLSETSKFYLFYYLCILEIVPIVIIAKSIIYL